MSGDMPDLVGQHTGNLGFVVGQPRHADGTPHPLDAAMFTTGATAFLKWQDQAHPWRFSGYGAPQALPEHAVRLTPHITCQALTHGYVPQVHESLSL